MIDGRHARARAGARPRRRPLHGRRDGSARRRRRSRVRVERFRLPLLHALEARQMRQPRLALHDVRGDDRARRRELVLVDEIPAPGQPQRRRPPVRQRRLPLRQRRRRRLRLRGRQRLRTGRTTRRATRTSCSGRSCGSPAPAASRATIPSRGPAPPAATSRGRRRRATSARRPSPGACGTRSGSPSTRTPPAPASSSTTSARAPGRRSTSGRRAPTTAGTSARGPARTARRRTAARRRPGMTNPIYAYSHVGVRLRGDHRRRVRPERRLAGVVRRRLPLRRLHLRQDLPAPPRTAAAASRGASSRPDVGAVVNMTFGPSASGQALYYTNYSNGGEVRRIEPTVAAEPAADREHDRRAHAPATLPLAVELRREHELRPGRGRHAHVHLELRRRLAARDHDRPDDDATPTRLRARSRRR